MALGLLLFSIPFSSFAKVTLGQFTVTSTDALVALLLLGWLGPILIGATVRVHSGPVLNLAALFLITALLASATATDLPGAIKELIKFCEILGVAYFAASYLRTVRTIQITLWFVVAAATTEALVGLAQFATGTGPDSFAVGPFIRAYGNFEQPNALAGYLALSLPFAAILATQHSSSRVGIGATVVIGAAVAASLSRGAWVGIALGFGAMALVSTPKARQWVAPSIGVLVLMLALTRAGLAPETLTARLSVLFENWVFDVRTVETTEANWSLVERMAHWQAGWAIALDHPLTGIGPGNWDKVYEDYYLPGWREGLGHAHNYYINTFAELGIIGLTAFLALLVEVFLRLRVGLRASRRILHPDETARVARAVLIASLGAVISFSTHNMFDNMFIHGIGIQFGLILGLIESQTAILVSAQRGHAQPASSEVRPPSGEV